VERLDATTFVQTDIALASTDLALLRTHNTTPCFVPLGNADALKIGQHIITIGHPALSGAAVLFEGFISSKHRHLPTPIGYVGSEPVLPQYEILRVQMPILAGASGSPVISDADEVVGVISEVPTVWTRDLQELVQKGLVPSGIQIGGFDTNRLLAQLALVVHEFESPGSGLAVPISYLRSVMRSNQNQ